MITAHCYVGQKHSWIMDNPEVESQLTPTVSIDANSHYGVTGADALIVG
jgi:hypothetical protein